MQGGLSALLKSSWFYAHAYNPSTEILQVVLDELCGPSVVANDIASSTITSTTSCNTCFLSSSQEASSSILALPLMSSISESLNHFLEPEQLTGEYCWSFPQCSSYKECTRVSSCKTCARILIIQLRRFTNLNGSLFKDNRVVNCYLTSHQTLTVPSHPEEDISFKSFSESAPSNWHQHQRGIFAGCTLSIILFLAGMNIILEYVLVACAPHFITSSKVSLPLVKAFMDDVNLMSSSVSGAQTLLARCATALQWAGMEFRADKSRSFIIKKGKSLNSSPFCVSEPSNPTDFSLFIPSIHSMPVRFLGRIIDGSITDRKSVDELAEKLSDGLKIIDKSPFKGTQKLWILQHLLIPRIQWPLLIYEVPMSVAMRLEQKVSTYIRKWLHLHQSTTNLCFYSSTSPCPLPINSLTSILKSCKISGHLLLRDSKDPLVEASNPVLNVR